jgi:hypothetical protein
MLAWAVAVSLVFVLLLIWSALIRSSMAASGLRAGKGHGSAGRLATETSLEHGAEWSVSERGMPRPGIPKSGRSRHDVSGPESWAAAAIPQSEAGGAEYAAKHAAEK